MSLENNQFLLAILNKKDLVREDPNRFITSLPFVGNSFIVDVSYNTIKEIKLYGFTSLISRSFKVILIFPPSCRWTYSTVLKTFVGLTSLYNILVGTE